MQFVNRDKETKEIAQYYNGLAESTILLMYSKTGVGKSTVSQKIIATLLEEKKDIVPVHVSTNKINQNNNSTNGEFLFDVFRAIIKVKLPDKKTTFKYYMSHIKNSEYRKYVVEKLLLGTEQQSTVSAMLLKILSSIFIKGVFRLCEFNYERLLDDYSNQTFQIISGYVEYFLSKTTAIINIDNIQNIDNVSYKFLMEWIVRQKARKHLFLLEYTVSKDDTEKVLRFRDNIRQLDVPVILYELPNMSFNHAIEAAKSNANFMAMDVSEVIPKEATTYYKKSNGNIRSLEDFIRHYNKTDHQVSYTPLADIIEMLSKEELIIFCIVCLSKGKINSYELKCVVDDMAINLMQCLDTLVNKYDLIEYDQDFICIKHASIYDEWEKATNPKFNISNTIAYEALKQHYEQIIQVNEFSKSPKIYLDAMRLYAIYEPDKIYDILNSFEDIIQEFVSPNQLSEYIISVDNELSENANHFVSFYYKLIDLCLETKLFVLANTLLDRVRECSSSIKYTFYYCNVLHQSERHHESIRFIENAIEYVQDDYFAMYLRLFLLVAYRSINDYKNAQKTDIAIQHQLKEYEQTLFFAFYLRLAEIRKSRNNAIDDVEKSVRIFKQMKLEIQEAKSRVTLSFLYAVAGRIAEAFKQIDRAEKVIIRKIANRHIFFNNKAALYMLDGRYGNEVWNMLEAAELTAITVFDQLAIYNNKLALSLEVHDLQKAKHEKNKICKLIESEVDKHLIAIIYYNLYLYYKYANDISSSEKCLAKCHALKSHSSSLYARLVGTKTIDGTDILISKPWHICFLDYWNIDYVEEF